MVVPPVYWRAMVVPPVCCAAILPPVLVGLRGGGERNSKGRRSYTGDEKSEEKKVSEFKTIARIFLEHLAPRPIRRTKHSLHHTPPSPASLLAELSSCFPQPALPSLLRPPRPLASFPPQTKHVACHLEPCGPGTTPLSMTETD